jgi:hypothetical protein
MIIKNKGSDVQSHISLSSNCFCFGRGLELSTKLESILSDESEPSMECVLFPWLSVVQEQKCNYI